MSIEIFYHMYCVDNCVDRFLSTYNKIKEAGLLDACNNFHVVLVGNNNVEYESALSPLYKIKTVLRDNFLGEMDTIKYVHNFCQTNVGSQILYLHSKGASKNGNPNVKAWVDYMEYFLIEKYQTCLDFLNQYDTVGVDYLPAPLPHYSGNFWWANSSYINTHVSFEEGILNSIITDLRWYCEFWLLHDEKVKHKCLHNSNIDLYGNLYTRDKYAFN